MRVAESTSGKTWQQKWVTLAADGTLTVADKRNSKRRGRQMYDIRRDCMYIWTAAQVCLLNGSLQLLGRRARLFACLLTCLCTRSASLTLISFLLIQPLLVNFFFFAGVVFVCLFELFIFLLLLFFVFCFVF